MPSRLVNFSDSSETLKVLNYVRTLKGEWMVSIERESRQRSSPQNRWLWAHAYKELSAGFQGAWGSAVTEDEVHEWAKRRWLSKPIVDRRTGEVKEWTCGSTKKLSTVSFSVYGEELIKFGAEFLNVTIKWPDDGFPPDDAALPTGVRHAT